MKPDIISKLYDCLDEKDYSERDVVYILVQSYKLIEREKRKKDFSVIKFYRNWACHAVLYGYRDIFEPVIEKNKNGAESWDDINLTEDKIRESFRKYSPNKLKEQLIGFIKEFIDDENTLDWDKFRRCLYEVIKDIKIVVKDKEEEIFIFECRDLLVDNPHHDDLRIGVEMRGVSFEFHINDESL